MNKFYEKYGINHITTAPYHPARNGFAERFVRSFKEAMIKQQQSGQTNKITALRNVLRSYRWIPHTSTDASPANMLLKHSIRTELDVMKSYESIKPQYTKYAVGQLVWTLKYQLNKRPQWQQAIITKNISSVIYEVQLSDGQRFKRHQNQLCPRYSSDNQTSEIDSLPDDVLNIKSQSKTVKSASSSSRRYPSRNRKPSNRYSPS